MRPPMSALHALLLELVAGRQNCQPRPNSQQQTLALFLSSFQSQQFYLP